MSEKYDHTQLVKGDLVVYGTSFGFGYGQWRITRTKVERLTATQIVLEDGQRFRRDTGKHVRARDFDQLCKMLDPKGQEVRNTMGSLEASAFGSDMSQWDKQRRNVQTLEGWEVCLAQLDALVARAKRRIEEVKKGLE